MSLSLRMPMKTLLIAHSSVLGDRKVTSHIRQLQNLPFQCMAVEVNAICTSLCFLMVIPQLSTWHYLTLQFLSSFQDISSRHMWEGMEG